MTFNSLLLSSTEPPSRVSNAKDGFNTARDCHPLVSGMMLPMDISNMFRFERQVYLLLSVYIYKVLTHICRIMYIDVYSHILVHLHFAPIFIHPVVFPTMFAFGYVIFVYE